jgi:hypothetical protein
MKVIAKPIEMVAWFTKEGIPHPVRFRIQNKDETFSVVKINRVILIDKEKLAGTPMYVFDCNSIINREKRMLQLKYELQSCKWMLFKI